MTLAVDRFPNSSVHLPGYAILEQVYIGSSIGVYRALEETSQRSVIIKLLQREYPTFNDLLLFRNQYTIAKSLNISGIVQPYSLELYGNGYALVMEDFGGISLRDYAQDHALSLQEILTIALRLSEILHDLHQQRVIHKDIKPANILIHPEFKQIKLIDFSIASLLLRETQEIQNPQGLEGTLAYLAPEQTGRTNRGIDYRSDFYAFGVTLYELLTGQVPFQSDDPMELVHCHLAKLPIAPHEIKPEIPETVSQIVLKLMAKNAEDRYQSAVGLQHDLQNCLTQWKEIGEIQAFKVGQRDVSDRFLIPEKLYGRESEVQTLLDAFERVSYGASELLLVAGFSGVGKTAVISEVHKPIVRQRGYFTRGKFDQFQRNIPFSALLQAFRNLITQLLSESDSRLADWKAKILDAVGENGQVLIDLLPELAGIIGQQPPAPELLGSAAQNRFNLLFQKFIQVFTTAEHPLVIFLDDLQWADSASLNLLKILTSDVKTGYLLILAAYRDNEVFAAHPLMLTIDEIQKAQATVKTITLQPLDEGTIDQLVGDTLSCTDELARPLAQLVYQKTQGNPFFTTQFLKALYEDGLIQFRRDLGYWYYDLNSIQQLVLTDDVVEFMAQQLRKFPDTTQSVLKLAACIGNRFDLKTLAIVSQQGETETAAALWKALQEGFILPIGDSYRFFQSIEGGEADSICETGVIYQFLHDRIQQAAYSLIPEAQKQQTHLTIGQLLLQNYDRTSQDDRLFEIVNQLNCGIALVTDPTQQQQYAQLNLKAGRKAKESTAYPAAIRYLNQGIELLTDAGWESAPPLMHSLYEEAAEVALLNCDFEQMEGFIQVVLDHSRDLLEQVKVYEIQLQAHQVRNQQLQAIAIGREILQKLGVTLPDSVTPEAIYQQVEHTLEQTLAALPNRSIKHLVNLPRMQDANALAAARIMISLVPSIHQAAPHLFPMLVCEEVKLSLQYGNSPFSAPGYADFGIVLSAVLNQLEAGYQFGQLALKIMDQFSEKLVQSMVQFKVAAFSQSNQESIRQAIRLLKESHRVGLETGDSVHALVSTSFRLLYTYLTSQENLFTLLEEIDIYASRFATSQHFLTWAHILRSSIQNFTEFRENPGCLGVDAAAEDQQLSILLKENDELALHLFYLCKLILNYSFGRFPEAIDAANQGAIYLKAGMGMPSAPIYYYYDSLIRLTLYPTAETSEQAELLSQVNQNQEKLRICANAAPMNYQHQHDLVEALRHEVLGNQAQAIDFYDLAITGAHTHHFIQDTALANELAARFYLQWGKEKVAAGYLQEAYYGYSRWGAKAKTDDLERRYPQLLRPILQPTAQVLNPLETLASISAPHLSTHGSTDGSRTAGTNVNTLLDFTALLKASQTLSSTIQLDELLYQLTQIILQYASCDRCALICPSSEGEWQVKAIATPEGTELRCEPLEGNTDLPVKLIQYVKHTKELVLVDDMQTDAPVIDGYLLQRQPKSLLCLPILSQGQLIGILYLKNRATRGVFTSDRILILNFLCTQAAISLENARLYEKSQAYAQELERSLQILQTAQNKLRADEQMMQEQALALVKLSESQAISQGQLKDAFVELTTITAEILQVDRVSIWLVDDERIHLECANLFQRSSQQHSSGLSLKVANYPLYFAAILSQPILPVDDVWTDSRTIEFRQGYFDVFQISSMLDATVRLNGEISGVICCEHVGEKRDWSQAEQNFIRSVANLMALTLESNQRQQKAEQLKEVLIDLEQSQLQTVQNEKMASLGNLVAGVAHEINNPIGFLNGSINNAKDYVQDFLDHLALYQQHYASPAVPIQNHAEEIDLEFVSKDLPKLLTSMKGAVDRIKSISNSLRTFSRADTENKISANLHEGIDSTLLILKYRLKANDVRPAIQVQQEYGELPLIECFPGQLNQVFMNILANAIDMFDEMAKIASFQVLESQPQRITIETTVVDRQVQIKIRDNGTGMSEEVQARIFDHLFTTKAVGKGTGLGLAIARQIVVEKHQGSLEVQSTVGQGTEFCIRLPL